MKIERETLNLKESEGGLFDFSCSRQHLFDLSYLSHLKTYSQTGFLLDLYKLIIPEFENLRQDPPLEAIFVIDLWS